MKMYFKTRSQARTMANKTGLKAPRSKDDNGKWALKIK